MPDSPISAQAEKILSAIKAAGGWVSRQQLAESLGKKKLNPYDIATLDLLVREGRIQEEKLERPGIISYTFRYRINE
jgi:protein involved in polysaccharide export with SLBB domain